jgi:hypothetical protein
MANSFPGSGLAYADQFSVGTATASGLLTLKAEVTNTPTLVFLNSSGGPNSAISNFTSAAQTFTAIGANFVINSTANTVRFNNSYEGSGITFDEGLLRFYTGTSGMNPGVRMAIINNGNVGIGTTTPVGKLDISTGGNTNIVISNDSTDTGYNIISLNGTRTKGSYAGIAGGGTGDNKLYLNSGVEIVLQTGASYTERMRITSTGAMQMSRIASDITFGDNVGGMYVRQNGNGAGNQEELRIFGRNISLVSHTGTRYMDVTSTGNVGIGTSNPTTGKLQVAGSITTSGALSDALANAASLSFESTFSRLICFGANASTNGEFGLISSRSNGSSQLTWLYGTAAGNVGINTTSPGTYKLNVNGTFYSAGSSLEYKTKISTFDADTNKILELRPVTYQYKDEYKHLGKELKSGTQIGLIAEEVAEVFPELALLKQDEDGEIRVRNVDYEKLSILLLSEVQKLRKEVNELKKK